MTYPNFKQLMAKIERSDNKALGMFFTANKIKVKRSNTILSTGSSIFYDNLVAEEAKERKQKKKIQKEKEIKQKKEEQQKEPEHEHIAVVKRDSVRFLWAESEPVVSSGILDKITTYERTLQEAKFEIITTEVTYLNSLNELITKFMDNRILPSLCTREQWQNLFGNIVVVKAASELVLSDLVQHWHEDIMLTNIYTVLRQHAISILRVYIEYCRKQPYAQILLSQLKENEGWRKVLQRIERENVPNNSLQSYLSLPMQRVTRLPLLLEAVLSRLQEGTNEYTACKLAISAMKKLAKECNESVGKEKELPIQFLCNMSFRNKDKTGQKVRPASWTSTTSWEV